jgi:hypothetical protein
LTDGLQVPVVHGGTTIQEVLTQAASAVSISRTVPVQTSVQLVQALMEARPGDAIVLAPATFDGPIVLQGKTAVQISGQPGARIHSNNLGQAAVSLSGCQHCTLTGFAITGGQKGLLALGCSDNVFDALDISQTQMEGLHLKFDSCANIIRNCTVHDTGLGGTAPAGHGRTQADDGEGIYIGTAKSNNAQGDRSDNNIIVGNTLYNTTAETIDIKEFTSGGSITHNTLDGAGCQGGATGVVALKGAHYLVTGNTVRNAGAKKAFDVYSVPGVVDSGTDNRVEDNTIL